MIANRAEAVDRKITVRPHTLQQLDSTWRLKDGSIPGHGDTGELHVAFSIAREKLESWRNRLAENRVTIESENGSFCGGHSVYFRDPDGNLLELARPGLWAVY